MIFKLHVSEANSWLKCRRYHNWTARNGMRLEPKTYQGAFFMGSAIHYACEMHHGYGIPLLAGLQEFIEDKAPKELSFKQRDDLELCKQILIHYDLWYQRMQGEFSESNLENYYTGFHDPAVEVKISCPLYDKNNNQLEDVLLEGKIDRIVRKKDDNTYWLVEYKTTGNIEDRISLLTNEIQPAAYILMVERALGIKIKGVIYQFMLKKVPNTPPKLNSGLFSTSPTSLKNMSFDWFNHLVNNDPMTIITNAKEMYGEALYDLLQTPNQYFKRIAITRTAQQLREIELDLVSIAQEMLNPETRITHHRGLHCTAFGGCAFKLPCDTDYDPEQQTKILAAQYNVRSEEGIYD